MYEGMPENPKKEQTNENLDGYYEVAKKSLGAIFKTYSNGQDRVKSIKEEVKRMSSHIENSSQILEELDRCAAIDNRKEFIESVFLAMKPMIDLKISNPEVFIAEGEYEEKYEEINEVISCEIRNDVLCVHVIPDRTHSDIWDKVNEGFKDIARIVESDKNIKSIQGESWIVSKHPKIVEKFGFSIDKNETAKAKMSREDFLERYLK